MEIKMNKIESSDYYNEVLGLLSNYKKFSENPRQKIRGLNTQAMILTVISLVFLVIFSILYIRDQSSVMYLAVVVIFAIAFVAGIVYNILIKRRISNLKANNADRLFTIEDDFVELAIGSEKFRLEYSNIKYVIINKYSLCFMPMAVNADSKIIIISSEYKNEISKFDGYKSLIVDNSSLYQ